MTARTALLGQYFHAFGECEPLEPHKRGGTSRFRGRRISFSLRVSVADIRARLTDNNIVLNHLNTRPGETFGLAAQPARKMNSRASSTRRSTMQRGLAR